jgi:hypothetical protein
MDTSGNGNQRRQLTGEAHYKALSVRLQLELLETRRMLAITQAELARRDLDDLTKNLGALEQKFLSDELQAPAGAKFNWQTLSYDDPAPPASPTPP